MYIKKRVMVLVICMSSDDDALYICIKIHENILNGLKL